MTDKTTRRRPRWGTAAIIGVLVLVIAVVTLIALLTAASATPTASDTTAAATASAGSTASSAPTATSSPSVSPSKHVTPTPAVTASKPQPTKTATISSAAPITKSLKAEVTKMEAVKGAASGPGEIAGPSVRFTIRITNGTGKRFDLSNTVVNAYSGAQSTPATELEKPGAKSFPASVAAGESVTGVFVFNIAASQRGHVSVTVDTSVLNPVVAFVGSAPK